MSKIATISVEGLEVECIVGILDRERVEKQFVYVDVDMDYDIEAAAAADDFKAAIDYVAVSNCLRELLIESEYQLLETFVVEGVERLLRKYPAQRARIKVMKPEAIPEATWTALQYEQRRES
ncbi:MAG: dihydroneopterin aldolase [Planctomycetota bacterium]